MGGEWWWSWLLTAVGVAGFLLARRKVWWCWYVNLACQGLWLAYALATEQYGFVAAAVIYTVVFGANAWTWHREHREAAFEERHERRRNFERTMEGHTREHLDRAVQRLAERRYVPTDEGPEAGHTWRITHQCRGAYSVRGEDGHRDEPEFTPDTVTIEVREWSLSGALRKAADLPFSRLMGLRDGER